MKLAVLMDPPQQLKPYKDSTIAMIRSAQALGWECVFFTVNDMYCQEGRSFARVFSLSIKGLQGADWATSEFRGDKCLSDFDIILMRKDPPFDMNYITATYALDLAARDGVLVANNPQSIRDANEKFFTLHVPQCCPDTLVTKDIERLKAFWETQREVIFKPLDGMGGSSIFYVDKKGHNLNVILEVLTKGQKVDIMAQRYIPEIRTLGDKRILLVNGTPIEYGLARIPAPGEQRGNLAAGASATIMPLITRDRWICSQLAPLLQAKGLYFVGIDVIGEYLTEINVTSPTCIKEISEGTGLDIATHYLQTLEQISKNSHHSST